MRVIAGSLGGRTINTIECRAMRPTTDRVREAVFSALETRLPLEDYVAVDLYAGTGAMGIEAISRGVSAAFFVEREEVLVKQLKKNFVDLDIANRAKVIPSNVEKAGKTLSQNISSEYPDKRKLFLIDPPYTAHPEAEIFTYLAELIVADDFLVLGSPKRMSEDGILLGLEQLSLSVAWQKSKNYGDTRINFIEFGNG